MTREEITKDILKIDSKNILLELSTGVGKTKNALELADSLKPKKVLVVCPQLSIIESWKSEVIKWNKSHINVTYSTYASMYKHAGIKWDIVILDECHHLSDKKLQDLSSFSLKRTILLSATIPDKQFYKIKDTIGDIHKYSISSRKAIEDNILPKPKVLTKKLYLSNTIKDEIILNPKAKGKTINIDFSKRFRYTKNKTNRIVISCTQVEKNEWFNSYIEWAKNRYLRFNGNIKVKAALKNVWLQKCNERLKWLSVIKESYVKKIISYYNEERTITFCTDIEQTERLGKNAIHSKNRNALKILEEFNIGKVNHITAVNVLNEGVNLTNCKIGIWARYNSSDIMTIQKIGRLLRHKEPLIVLPYFKDTREEELANKIIEELK